MRQSQQPSKEQIREWLVQRRVARTPPPAMEQIRRELGWELVIRKPSCIGKR